MEIAVAKAMIRSPPPFREGRKSRRSENTRSSAPAAERQAVRRAGELLDTGRHEAAGYVLDLRLFATARREQFDETCEIRDRHGQRWIKRIGAGRHGSKNAEPADGADAADRRILISAPKNGVAKAAARLAASANTRPAESFAVGAQSGRTRSSAGQRIF